ncbi:tRNA lysidine(34) synthetase TilS [Corynebacterium breve]|uniref:tRNA(Ile)-lysidine synthase n=1 Tax=Corynebacterium breve TaxID=3049799 RepID=A0ABY8VE49_9CORY|nr:tRNA lysidine(34) synthetase TilS [Corynebacterium breve]WIM67372.1 tRNA lysidine(34) synthetase TilS [Corynebacterium breve]
MIPFWPRRSPHFLACRRATRPWTRPAIIGLSGGPDSLALVAAAAAEELPVEAVVVDHGLQPDSAEIARSAAAQARELGVSTRITRVSVAPGNVEAQAREARYQALHDIADGRDIWVGHTADDQAETLLLGLLRGNPTGMPPRNGQVVRPFLDLRRADTVAACAELGLSPWQDPMNNDAAYRRVRIRNEVLPLLGDVLGGDVVDPLAHAAGRIVADQDYFGARVSSTSDCAELAAMHPAVRNRSIVAWLNGLGVGASGSSISGIAALCTDWHGQGPVHVGGGIVVVRRAGQLVAEPEPER